MNKAVVSIDKHGNIDKYNVKFKNIFNMKDNFIVGENVFKLLDFIKNLFLVTLKNIKIEAKYDKALKRLWDKVIAINNILG